MGGVTKSDFEWRFIFEKSALKVEFQTRLFVFGVDPAWSFNLELFCIFGYFWLFLCGLLMPSEGALWALSCWMAPSFPLKFAKKSIFIKENWPSKKIFPLRGQNPGEAPRTPLTQEGVRDSARSASASYIHCFEAYFKRILAFGFLGWTFFRMFILNNRKKKERKRRKKRKTAPKAPQKIFAPRALARGRRGGPSPARSAGEDPLRVSDAGGNFFPVTPFS